jgi:hypothetical protein
VLAAFSVFIAIAAFALVVLITFVLCRMLMPLVLTFSTILVIASSFMPMMVLIPQVGTLLPLCCPGSPLRVWVLGSLLTHVAGRLSTRLPMLTSVSHSVMTIMVPTATVARYRRIAIRQNNSHQQCRQTFMHVRSPLVLIKLFFIDDNFAAIWPLTAGMPYSLQTHFSAFSIFTYFGTPDYWTEVQPAVHEQ